MPSDPLPEPIGRPLMVATANERVIPLASATQWLCTAPIVISPPSRLAWSTDAAASVRPVAGAGVQLALSAPVETIARFTDATVFVSFGGHVASGVLAIVTGPVAASANASPLR